MNNFYQFNRNYRKTSSMIYLFNLDEFLIKHIIARKDVTLLIEDYNE